MTARASFKPAPQFSPTQITETLASQLVDLYATAEADLTALIAYRLKQGLTDYPELTERLRIVQALREQAAAILNGIDTGTLAEEIVQLAATEGAAAAIARLGLAKVLPRPEGLTGITPASADAVALIALDLQNTLDQMHNRILRGIGDEYQQVMAQMAPALALGNSTVQLVQQKTIAAFLAKGITGFTDAGGRNWRIGSYSEMVTRTVTARAWQTASIGQMQNVGVNLVTPVIGRAACVRCSAWSGKILSTDGTPAGTYVVPDAITGEPTTITIDATLEEAHAAGLHHPNCGCVDVAYMPGLSKPPETTYDPQAEADRARLRELEREKRELKRQAEGAGDDLEKQRIKDRLKDKNREIRDHVDATDVVRQPHREQLPFSDGKPGDYRPPAPAPKAPRTPKPAPSKPDVPTPANTTKAPIVKRPKKPLTQAEKIQAINDAPTAKDVGRKLATYLKDQDITVAGFSADGIHIDTAREFARAIVDMTTQFPGTILRKVQIGTLPMNTYAQAQATSGRTLPANFESLSVDEKIRILRDSPAKLQDGTITLNRAYAKHRDELLRSSAADETRGFHTRGSAESGAYDTTVHEFGHLMDYTGQREVIQNYPTVLANAYSTSGFAGSLDDYIRKYTTGYGAMKPAEMIAEAFADVNRNGARASQLHKDMYAELLRGYEKGRTR